MVLIGAIATLFAGEVQRMNVVGLVKEVRDH